MKNNCNNDLSVNNLLMACLLGAFSLASCEKNAEAPSSTPQPTASSADAYGQPGVDHVANELLVKFKAGTSAATRVAALAAINGEVAERIRTNILRQDGDNESLLRVKTPLAAIDAIARIKGSSIEYAEPNVIYKAQSVAGDITYTKALTKPYYVAYDSYYVNTDGGTYMSSGEWGMNGATSIDFTLPNRNQFGSGADVAWANGNIGSSSVVIGIVDTGIQTGHPDLDGQVNNPASASTPYPYLDDAFGWNFINNNNDVSDYGSKPYSRDHGTYMAGIIGAKPDVTKNTTATSLVGMNWNVTLVAAKFMDAKGGTTANAVNAINYLVELKKKHGVNIVAINCSWGSTVFSQALFDAIASANTVDPITKKLTILIVASAGNGDNGGSPVNDDVTPFYPACYNLPNIISVAAINPAGSMYQTSNYGSSSVDLGAPGARIWTTVAGSSWYSYSGTSVATAFVTGAAALYAAAHPMAAAADIKSAIMSAASAPAAYTPSLAGKCVTSGHLDVSGF